MGRHTRYGSDAEMMSGPFIAIDEELHLDMSIDQQNRALEARRLRKRDFHEISLATRTVKQHHVLERTTLTVVTKVMTLEIKQLGLQTLAELVRRLEIQTIPLGHPIFEGGELPDKPQEPRQMARARSKWTFSFCC
jgi:hypothetical protein